MATLLILITLAIVAAVLTRAFHIPAGETAEAIGRELEEAKLTKYRELRELELDWRTGKLSDADYQQTRGQLRQEAAALLERIPPTPDETTSTNGGRA